MDYYKPLENLNMQDIVTFKSIGSPTQGKYGEQRQCEVTVNDSPKVWTISADKYKQLLEAGFNEGSTVKIQKWREGMKKGYNFVSATSNPYATDIPEIKYPQATEVPQVPQATENEKPDWDAIARGKVRNNVAVAFIRQGKSLSENKAEMSLWTDWIMNEQ